MEPLAVCPRCGTWVAKEDPSCPRCGTEMSALPEAPGAPGAVLAVTARDPAAPLDIPAWCFSTGHRLAAESPPLYWIRRKED